MTDRKYIPAIDLPGEVWYAIPGYEGFYEISNKLRVKSLKRSAGHFTVNEKILRAGWHKFGYPKYTLRKNGKGSYVQLHRLVALTFIPNPNNLPCVNHIDNNPLNNEVSNLEWCTWSQNSRHAYKQERLTKAGAKNHMAKLTEKEVLEIFNSHESQPILAKRYNVTQPTISEIKSGKRWYLLTGKNHPKRRKRICET